MPKNSPRIILASQSAARRLMLENSGLVFETAPAMLDEKSVIEELKTKKTGPEKIALELSAKKALAVAEKYPDALVIGADQILEFEGAIFEKAATPAEAKNRLKELRGKAHRLISAVSIAKSKTVLWSNSDEAVLAMHDFTDEFLDVYCENAGGALTRAVGGYELEGAGAWLFEKVTGDYFTVLGMPLLPLLAYLREYHRVNP